MGEESPVKPLANWDDDDSSHPDLVWWSRLDGRYQVEVHRTGSHSGVLLIFDHQDGDKLIHQEDVGLYYGAIFGPDFADVAEWQEKTIRVIDNLPKSS